MFALLKKSDARIVRQVLSGQRERFDTLVERYLPAVYAVAYAQLHNHADAEDAAQEAFLSAFTTLHTLREPAKFEGWVVTIARRLSIKMRQKHIQERTPDGGEAPEPSTTPDTSRDELRQLLRSEIERLETDAREILLLHYFTGRSTGEIAATLDISREAAKKRLQRARKTLSDNLLELVEEESRPKQEYAVQRKAIMGLVATAAVSWGQQAEAASGFGAMGGTGAKAKLVALATGATAAITGSVYWVEISNRNAMEPPQVDASSLTVSAVGTSRPTSASAESKPTLVGAALLEEEASPAASTSETSLWRICDNLGYFSQFSVLAFTRTEDRIEIYVADTGVPEKHLTTGTLHDNALDIIIDGQPPIHLTGAYVEDGPVVLVGTVESDGASTDLEITLSLLSERDAAEVEIQGRRMAEVEQLLRAIRAYSQDNGGAYPEQLSDLSDAYLAQPLLAESTPSRRIQYLPGFLPSLDMRSAYPNAATHRERLLKVEAERLGNWASYPEWPPELEVVFSVPAMTLSCERLGSLVVRRTDVNSPMACPKPNMSPWDQEAMVQSCSNNLKQLGLTVKLFAAEDRESRFPGGWATAAPDYLRDPRVLTCPGHGKDLAGKIVTYELLFPAYNVGELRQIVAELGFGDDEKPDDLSKCPLVIELDSCSGSGKTNVLFADGHVEALSPKGWQKKVATFLDYVDSL